MSNTAVAVCVLFTFVALALWHFGMAYSAGAGGVEGGAVPSVGGKPLFVPSKRVTVAVGVVLLLFALLVAATAGLVQIGVSSTLLAWASFALALGLLLRAIGDFRYVGFFKRVRGSSFARLDTLLYSPLCLLLAIGVAWIAQHNGI